MQIIWKAAMQGYAEKDWRDFVFFSANVQHLLGIHQLDIQQNLHRAAINFSRRQAETDATKFQFEDETYWLSPERAQFILSFHFGYYRAVPAFLVQRGYKLCIPVAKEVMSQQSQHYAALLGDRWQKQVIFLEAEDPYLFFKLRRQMDLGYHIFCYLDGGVSAAKEAQRSKLKKIPFLNGQISVQYGLLDMVHLLGKKMTVLIAEMPLENENIIIRTLDHCDVNWYPNRTHFTEYYSRIIYEDFEEVLLEYPEAWEAWFYLHKIMSPSSDVASWPAKTSRIISFSIKEKQLLFDKFTYLSYLLPETIF